MAAGDGVGISTRVAKTTIANWAPKLSELTMNKFVVLAALKAKGRIKYEDGGGQKRWAIRKKEHELAQHTDGAVKSFSRINDVDNAVIPLDRGYEVKDAATRMEMAQQRGKAAMIKYLQGKTKDLKDSAFRRLEREWYRDGNATGNESRYHGIESFCSMTGQTDGDELATTPNDSYAGFSTDYTGIDSAAVAGDPTYGIWTPALVNTNRNPGSGNRNWEDYANEYLRLLILECSKGSDPENMLDLITLHKTSYRQALNLLEEKERIIRGDDPIGLTKLGFKHTFQFDGVTVTWDEALSTFRTDASSDTVHGYGWNLDKVGLCVLNEDKQLWSDGSGWDVNTQTMLYYLYNFANLYFESPRYFGKLVDLAA